MKALIGVVFISVACSFQSEAAKERLPPRPNDVLLVADFETPKEQRGWSTADFATWSPGYQGKTSLCVSVPPGQAAGVHMVQMPLDLTPYRGCRLLFECMAKADAVTKPPAPHLGTKFMLHYQSQSVGHAWANESNVYGTFDWRKLQFLVSIPLDITGAAETSLGLQDSSGTVCFDSVKVTVFKGPLQRPKPPINPPPAFKGHNLPRLRGVMSPDFFRDEDIRVLGTEWKANLIRWQITRNWGRSGTDRDLADFDRWFESRLAELDKVLVSCHKYGVKVVVDMHSPPGGRYPNHDLAIFNEPQYQSHFIALWEKVARRYKGNPAIWGYDLINEPVQNVPSPSGVADYLGAQVKAAKAIRAIDAKTPILIEAADWDSAEGYRELEPIDVSNVIYQVHMYAPGEFTHQGVYLADPSKAPSIAYPGKIGNMEWDKNQLRRMLHPVRDFQLAYNVHIYVGEFGAVRWAPGAANYLRDCIELFEEYGWDWSYFAFREGDAWSVEHGSDPKDHNPVQESSDRKQLLLGWFSRNVKP